MTHQLYWCLKIKQEIAAQQLLGLHHLVFSSRLLLTGCDLKYHQPPCQDPKIKLLLEASCRGNCQISCQIRSQNDLVCIYSGEMYNQLVIFK